MNDITIVAASQFAGRRARCTQLVIGLCMITVLAHSVAARAQETLTPLSKINVSTTTADKPQSKLWFYANHWWAVLPSSSVSPSGTWLWRLDADNTWKNVLRLTAGTSSRADAKSLGDVTHVFLFNGSSSSLVSIEYVAATDTYVPWSVRGTATALSLSGSETATIDIDTTGRLWVSTENGSNVIVYHSDPPYSSFTGPFALATNIAADDITMVRALPIPLPSKVGVFWSNQNTKRFGFRTHVDTDPPTTWSADEVPAGAVALNVGGGMADDHMNDAVASDGTYYASVKTSYNSSSQTLIGLLVRRPNGVWDNALYNVEKGAGTRPLVVLNEALGFLRVVYTANSGGGNIYYRDSALSPIVFGARQTAIAGGLNNATSTKDNWTDQLVVIASGSGVLFREGGVGTTTTVTSTTSTTSSTTTSTSVATTSTTSTSAITTSTTSSSTATTGPTPTSSTTSSSSTTSTTSTSVTTTTLAPTGSSTFQAGVSGPTGSANVDTNIRLSTPTRNWGTDPSLYVGVTNAATNVYRTIMAFDLSSIPAGATISGCKLTVNVTQRTSPSPGHVRRLCGEHWLDGDGQSEAQATWEVWKTGTTWGVGGAGSTAACDAGGDYTTTDEVAYTPPAGTGPFTFPDLTALCRDAFTQRGGRLRLRLSQDAEATQGNLIKFDSSDGSTAANRPKLVVSWATP